MRTKITFKSLTVIMGLLLTFNFQAQTVTIHVETADITLISIYNMSGQKIYQSTINGNAEINLGKGIYIVRANNESQKMIIPQYLPIR